MKPAPTSRGELAQIVTVLQSVTRVLGTMSMRLAGMASGRRPRPRRATKRSRRAR